MDRSLSFCSILLAFFSLSVQARDAEPSRRVARVDWAAAAFTEAPPPHSEKVAAEISTVQLPVLIPESFARFRSFEVVSAGPYDYTASVRLKDAKLSINGTRQEVIPPAGAMAGESFEPDLGAFIETDPPEPRIANRRFSRFGVGYVISVECVKPSDTRCDDAYLASLEQSVRLFGGTE